MTKRRKGQLKRRQSAIPLGRWFGIEVGADYSWIIIVLLVTLSLGSRFSELRPGWGEGQGWTFGVITSALFFVSIILHELGHSLVAIRLGIPVRSITLFIFGGIARLEKEPSRPRDEALIALAGPAVSLSLAGFFGGLVLFLGAQTPVGTTAAWLAGINGVLALFNMIPGFPLDGGRVLRAVLWAYKSDFGWATTVASRVGGLVAYGFMGWGVFTALFQEQLFNGLWLGFIGWFLLSASKSSAVQVLAQEVLVTISVSEVTDRSCELISPASSLEEVMDNGVLRRGQRCFMVGRDGALVGLLTIREIGEVPREEWPTTSVQAAMIELEALRTVTPDVTLLDALHSMDEGGVNQLPVVKGGVLFGVLTRERLLGVIRNQLAFRT